VSDGEDALIRASARLPAERLARMLGVDAARLEAALNQAGFVLLHASDVQQLGQIGDTCTWPHTGLVCPYCECERKPEPLTDNYGADGSGGW
jgi:hypothetical protein